MSSTGELRSPLSPMERDRLLSGDGDRIDVANRVPGTPCPFYVENRPGKMTLFAPGVPVGSKTSAILDLFASSPDVGQVAVEAGLTIVRGHDFVDVGSTKLQGLQRLESIDEVNCLDLERIHVCIGDSANDAGIFEYCSGARRKTGSVRVFVGSDEEFCNSLRSATDDLVYLEGGFLSATACVFSKILGDEACDAGRKYPSAWQRILDRHLPAGGPGRILAVTDMTGCHLRQDRYDFPEPHRENLRRFVKAGGMLWLVSGDAIEVIDAMFIAPLGDLGNYAYYVVSSGGYRGDRVRNGKRTRVFQREPLSPATREQLLNLAEAMIVSGT